MAENRGPLCLAMGFPSLFLLSFPGFLWPLPPWSRPPLEMSFLEKLRKADPAQVVPDVSESESESGSVFGELQC